MVEEIVGYIQGLFRQASVKMDFLLYGGGCQTRESFAGHAQTPLGGCLFGKFVFLRGELGFFSFFSRRSAFATLTVFGFI